MRLWRRLFPFDEPIPNAGCIMRIDDEWLPLFEFRYTTKKDEIMFKITDVTPQQPKTFRIDCDGQTLLLIRNVMKGHIDHYCGGGYRSTVAMQDIHDLVHLIDTQLTPK